MYAAAYLAVFHQDSIKCPGQHRPNEAAALQRRHACAQCLAEELNALIGAQDPSWYHRPCCCQKCASACFFSIVRCVHVRFPWQATALLGRHHAKSSAPADCISIFKCQIHSLTICSLTICSLTAYSLTVYNLTVYSLTVYSLTVYILD